jgi:hypothetical protein
MQTEMSKKRSPPVSARLFLLERLLVLGLAVGRRFFLAGAGKNWVKLSLSLHWMHCFVFKRSPHLFCSPLAHTRAEPFSLFLSLEK